MKQISLRMMVAATTPFALALLLFSTPGCTAPRAVHDSPPPTVPLATDDARLLATLWFQSAEGAATYWQAFATARLALDATLAGPAGARPYAIITDIDETVLDNSGYQTWLIRHRLKYSTNTWKQWTSLAQAPATPGASNFLHYAAGRGVEIFYVTNRDLDETEATLRNLRAAGFPFATSDHLFTKRTVSSKEERRREIAQRFTVCLFLGDNLADLSAAFDGASVEARGASVMTNAGNFGRNCIVFPNPMYGDWERAKPAAGPAPSNVVDRLRGPATLPRR